jgi:hypothetical protein
LRSSPYFSVAFSEYAQKQSFPPACFHRLEVKLLTLD